MKFYLTFGQQSTFRNGWVEIEAKSLEVARNLVFDLKSGLITWPDFDSRLLSLLVDWK
jgi:hypothetical protein